MANKQRHDRARKEPDRAHLEKLLDEGLKGTFPASDPVAIDIVERADADGALVGRAFHAAERRGAR